MLPCIKRGLAFEAKVFRDPILWYGMTRRGIGQIVASQHATVLSPRKRRRRENMLREQRTQRASGIWCVPPEATALPGKLFVYVTAATIRNLPSPSKPAES
jgi:hypothetical protein